MVNIPFTRLGVRRLAVTNGTGGRSRPFKITKLKSINRNWAGPRCSAVCLCCRRHHVARCIVAASFSAVALFLVLTALGAGEFVSFTAALPRYLRLDLDGGASHDRFRDPAGAPSASAPVLPHCAVRPARVDAFRCAEADVPRHVRVRAFRPARAPGGYRFRTRNQHHRRRVRIANCRGVCAGQYPVARVAWAAPRVIVAFAVEIAAAVVAVPVAAEFEGDGGNAERPVVPRLEIDAVCLRRPPGRRGRRPSRGRRRRTRRTRRIRRGSRGFRWVLRWG